MTSAATLPAPTVLEFPPLAARDLERRAVGLPEAFTGDRNLVFVAFRMQHQRAIDAWVQWYDSVAAQHPDLRVYEVPVIATRFSPARPFIDGGMAQAVRDRDARRRTLTVYTDVRRVADALEIESTEELTVLVVDRKGRILGRTTGPPEEAAIAAVLPALGGEHATAPGEAEPLVEQFEFDFDARFRPALALAGVTPGTARVTVSADRLVVRFGPWSCETPLANVRDVNRSGPYRAYRAIGARGSFGDRGVTFGTTARGGVCIRLHEPVPGLLPFGALRHPGITLTLAEPERFVAAIRRRAPLR